MSVGMVFLQQVYPDGEKVDARRPEKSCFTFPKNDDILVNPSEKIISLVKEHFPRFDGKSVYGIVDFDMSTLTKNSDISMLNFKTILYTK